jgi:hypothetical protein
MINFFKINKNKTKIAKAIKINIIVKINDVAADINANEDI